MSSILFFVPKHNVTPPLVNPVSLNYSALEQGDAVPGNPNFDYPTVREADFAFFATKGIKMIRLPIKWDRLQPTINGALDATYLGFIDQAVTYAKNHGMTIMLDVHNYGGRKVSGVDRKFGNAELPDSAFADLWSRIATHYLGEEGMEYYDLMNEPSNMPNLYAWTSAAQAAINAIRLIDTTKTIFVEGNGYSSAYQWIENNPDIHTIVDPANNMRFSAHCYLDRNNSGSHFIWDEEVAAGDELDGGATLDTNIGIKRISVFQGWLEQYGFKGHIGEMGAGFDNPEWWVALDKAVGYCVDKRIMFSYWASGPYFATYPYSVQPNGVPEKHQWAVLTKYTTDPVQPNVYFLTGPERGTAGAASAPFSVDYRGLLAEPIVVTPSDGGVGGLFTPASVTLQPGFNAIATFTYTAPDTAVYRISVTNDKGYTNPGALGYATINDLFTFSTKQPTYIRLLKKKYAPYFGPALRLRRESDNAESDFNFFADVGQPASQLNADIDIAAINTWRNGSRVFIVKHYDQSANARHAGPPKSIDGSGDGANPTNADQPELIMTGGPNGKPFIRWNNSRMDVRSPINGRTEMTIISAFKATSRTGGRKLAWDLVQNHAFPDSDGTFGLAGTSKPTMLIDANVWGSYFGRWRANVTKGQSTWKNGAKAQEADTIGQNPLTFQFRDVCKLGYFVFAPVYWQGDEIGEVVFDGALSDAEMLAWADDLRADYALPAAPTPPTFATPPAADPNTLTPFPHNGVNLAGMEFGGLAFYPNSNEASYYYSRGFNTVRLPIHWERIQPTLGAALDTTHLANVTNVVNVMRAAGLNILLDLHNYGAYDDGTGGKGINSVGGPTYAQFADVWSRLATAFGSNPKIMFDLMNEPANVSTATMTTANQAAIDAIRLTGFTGYIHVEAGGFAGAHDWINSGSAAAFLTLTDPEDKLIAHVHQYLDSNNSGTGDVAVTGKGATVLVAATNFARSNGIKMHLGEYGIANTPSMFTEGAAMLAYMGANDDVWIGHTIWAGGPAWGDGYFQKVEPAGFTAPIIDKPQIPLIHSRF